MAVARLDVGLLLVLSGVAFVAGYSPPYKYLTNNCSPAGAISISRDLVLAYDHYKSTFPRNYRCEVSVVNMDSRRQIQVQFRYLNIPARPNPDCSKVGVAILEGTTPLTPRNGVCGTVPPADNYRTSGNAVTVVVDNRGQATAGDFELLLTSFYYPPQNISCDAGDFRCDNGICISGSLTCNGFNDCGDNSDEEEGCILAVGVIVGIVFAALVGITCFCCLFICFCRRRRSYIRVTETVREYPNVQVVTTTSGYVPSYAASKGGYQTL